MTRPGIKPATSRSQSGCSTTEPLCWYIHSPQTVQVCTKFQLSRLQYYWEKCTKISPEVWKMERGKHGEIKEWIRSSIIFSVHIIHKPTVQVCTNSLDITVTEKSVTKFHLNGYGKMTEGRSDWDYAVYKPCSFQQYSIYSWPSHIHRMS